MKTRSRAAKRADPAAETQSGNYNLQLYVTGSTPRSSRSIVNIRRLCEDRLTGRYNLQVIDIYQQPELARREQIVAAPTLIKSFPPPLRKVVGDLSDEAQVLQGLDLSREDS